VSELRPEVLRKVKPAALRVELPDGTLQDVAVPDRARKWVSVQQTVEAMDWTRAQLLDDAGAVVRVVRNERAIAQVEAQPRGELDDASPELRAIVAAQRLALEHQTQNQKQLMDALVASLDSANKRVAALERALANAYAMLDNAMRTQVELTQTAAEAEAATITADNQSQMMEAFATFMAAQHGATNGKAS
jgi:hypothetical protein